MIIIKRALIFCIIFSMLFTASCSKPMVTDTNTEQCAIYPCVVATYNSAHTAGDFQVTVDSIDLDYAASSIIMTISNPTDKLASCDKTFDIDKLHDGHWETCKIEEPVYAEKEKGIPQKGSAQVTFEWSTTFEINEPGTYRFRTNIFHDAVATREKNELIIEFTVSYENVTPLLHSYEIAPGSALISIDWKNNSDSNIYLTDVYSVEAMDNGEWIECNKTETDFPLVLFAIAPGESAEKHYPIDTMYELSYYGNYRVFLEYVTIEEDKTESHYALIEFFIPYEINITE